MEALQTGDRVAASGATLTGSQENIPGSNSGLLEKLVSAPFGVRLDYHNKINSALTDPETGQDTVAEILGIPSPRILATGPSIYAHDGIVEVNPADILTGFQSVEDATRYMILRGAFTSQNAIAGLDPKTNGNNRAAIFDIGRVPTEQEVLRIYEAFTNKGDTAIFLNDQGLSLVKLGLEFNGPHTKEMWDATVNKVQTILGAKATPFKTDTIYHENEYDQTTDIAKDGDFHYQSRAFRLGLNARVSSRPLDIQTRGADRLRARLAAVNQEFANQGYGNPEPVHGSKLLADLGLGQQPGSYQGEVGGKSDNPPNVARPVRGQPGDESTGRRFRDGLQRVYDEHPQGKAVTVKDLEFYSDPKTTLFLGGDGLAGVAVTPSGDLVSVFKHPSSTTTKAEMAGLLRDAARISKTLDAYDINGFLPTLYSQFGFEPVARLAFNREFAPEGWTYDTLGEPDVVFMAKTKEGPQAKVDYNTIRNQIPVVQDWDEGVALQQQAQQRLPESPVPEAPIYEALTGEALPPMSPDDIRESVTTTFGEAKDRALRNVLEFTVPEPPARGFLDAGGFNEGLRVLLGTLGDPTQNPIVARGRRTVNLNAPDDATAKTLAKLYPDIRWDQPRNQLRARAIHALTKEDRKTPNPDKIKTAGLVPQTLRQADYVAEREMVIDNTAAVPMLVFAKLYIDPDSPTGQRWHFVEVRKNSGMFETQYSDTNPQSGRALVARVVGIGDSTPKAKKKKPDSQVGYGQATAGEVSPQKSQAIEPLPESRTETIDTPSSENVQEKILEQVTILAGKRDRFRAQCDYANAGERIGSTHSHDQILRDLPPKHKTAKDAALHPNPRVSAGWSLDI